MQRKAWLLLSLIFILPALHHLSCPGSPGSPLSSAHECFPMGLLFSFMFFGHLYHSVLFLFPAHHHMKARPLLISDRHKPDIPTAAHDACLPSIQPVSVTNFASFLSVLLGLERSSHPDLHSGPKVMILGLQRVSVPVINFLPWEHILSQPLGHPAELSFLLDCTNWDFSLKFVPERLIR